MDCRHSTRRMNRIASLVLSIAGLTALPSAFLPAASAQALDGFWQSDAYGLLLEIRGAKLSTFQITSISCLVPFIFAAMNPAAPGTIWHSTHPTFRCTVS